MLAGSPAPAMTDLLVTAFVTFLVVIDPIGQAPLFAALTPGLQTAERRRIALRGVLIAAGILVAFSLGGAVVLDVLGIGLPAFRIAGGLLLVLLSIDMVMARHSGLSATTPEESQEAAARSDIAVFPLAIPLIAGPGAITAALLQMGRAGGSLLAQAAVLGVMLGVLLLTLGSLLLTDPIMRLLGVTGTNVLTRVFGIITAALGVQFIADGVLTLLASV
jgi:multiple antibiotic resistance protein